MMDRITLNGIKVFPFIFSYLYLVIFFKFFITINFPSFSVIKKLYEKMASIGNKAQICKIWKTLNKFYWLF